MNFLVRLITLATSARALRSKVSNATSVAKQVSTKIRTFDSAYIRGTVEKADQGNANSQFDLGDRYYDGLGVAQDFSQAAYWFERAAQQGHTRAQVNLGMMYAVGRGVDRDDVEGYKWLSLAAVSGDPGAIKNGVKLASRMSSEQIAEANRRVAQFQKA